jgi:hypothetical protein
MDATGRAVNALLEEKRLVKLLSGSNFSTISPQAQQRALDTIGQFSVMAAQHGVPLQAIATAGLRDAQNGSDLVRAVHAKVCSPQDALDSCTPSFQASVCCCDHPKAFPAQRWRALELVSSTVLLNMFTERWHAAQVIPASSGSICLRVC